MILYAGISHKDARLTSSKTEDAMSAPKILIPEQELHPICYGTFRSNVACQCDECTEKAEYQITLGTTSQAPGCFFTVAVCKTHIGCFLRPSGEKRHD